MSLTNQPSLSFPNSDTVVLKSTIFLSDVKKVLITKQAWLESLNRETQCGDWWALSLVVAVTTPSGENITLVYFMGSADSAFCISFTPTFSFFMWDPPIPPCFGDSQQFHWVAFSGEFLSLFAFPDVHYLFTSAALAMSSQNE